MLCVTSPIVIILKLEGRTFWPRSPSSHPQPLVPPVRSLFVWVQFFYTPHVSAIMQYLSFSVLLSLSEALFRFVHIVGNGRVSFSFYGWIIFIWHLFVACVSISAHEVVSLPRRLRTWGAYLFKVVVLFPLDVHPRVHLPDHTAVLLVIFGDPPWLFSVVAAPSTVYKRFPFSTSLPTFAPSYLFSKRQKIYTLRREIRVSVLSFWW